MLVSVTSIVKAMVVGVGIDGTVDAGVSLTVFLGLAVCFVDVVAPDTIIDGQTN